MRWWHELRYLWRKLNRQRAEQEMEEEIRSHLELETVAKIEAGLEPREAQYAARRASGSILSAKEKALAAAGIYGVISHSVAQQTHEIGVRIALGAQRSEVLKLVLRQGMILAFGGVCAGFLGSLALARILTTHLYGVTSTDPGTYLSISVLALVVALLACLRPAYRATRVDPIVALKYE